MRPRDSREIRLFFEQRAAAESEARDCGMTAEDARDVAQEALVIVAKHLERETFAFLSTDRAEQIKIARAYLRTVARRLALAAQEAAVRRRETERAAGRPLVVTLDIVEHQADALYLLSQTELANARAIIGWAEGESAWETGVAQGVSPNTVWTRRALALRDLQAAARREMVRAEGLPRGAVDRYRADVPAARYTIWLTASEAERVQRYLEQERARAVAAGQREPKDSPLLVAALLRGIGPEVAAPKAAPKASKPRAKSSKAPARKTPARR